MNFDQAFEVFTRKMRDKFEQRHRKQHDAGNRSVLDSGFTATDLNAVHVWDHLKEEMTERFQASTEAEKALEDVDVANMSFLDWWLREGCG